jgi:hypothetical protein
VGVLVKARVWRPADHEVASAGRSALPRKEGVVFKDRYIEVGGSDAERLLLEPRR